MYSCREHHDRIRQTFGGFDNIDRIFGHGAFALGAPPQDDRHREPQGGRDRDISPRDLQGGLFGMNSMIRDMEGHFVSFWIENEGTFVVFFSFFYLDRPSSPNDSKPIDSNRDWKR